MKNFERHRGPLKPIALSGSSAQPGKAAGGSTMATEKNRSDDAQVQISDSLGPQPNGDFKLVSTIPELYVEAVREWAANDGLTMEQWIDYRLSNYLETWSAPARGR